MLKENIVLGLFVYQAFFLKTAVNTLLYLTNFNSLYQKMGNKKFHDGIYFLSVYTTYLFYSENILKQLD